MSQKSNIAWCDSTANPVIGCDKVSAGCLNCYAQVDTPARILRHRGIETWGPKGVRHPVKGFEKSMLSMNRKPWVCDETGQAFNESDANDMGMDYKAGAQWHRRRVFVGSNCDWLDPKWSIHTLAHMLDVIYGCPNLWTILCTKRPENFLPLLQTVWRMNAYTQLGQWICDWVENGKPPPNVCLLTSVEDQATADERIPHLLKIPAAIRGLSVEPLLGPVDLTQCCADESMGVTYNALTGKNWSESPLPKIDWVIVGGESGSKARPCEPQWIRSIVQQCKAAEVPVFVKQLGSNPYWNPSPDAPAEYADRVAAFEIKHRSGADPAEWPDDLRVRQWPKGM